MQKRLFLFLFFLIIMMGIIGVMGLMAGSTFAEEAAHTHKWSAWETYIQPTCTKPGVQRRHCTHDECFPNAQVQTRNTTISHSLGSWKHDSSQHMRQCTRSGCAYQVRGGHSWSLGYCKTCYRKK